MAKTPIKHFVRLGPAIPTVPITDFSRIRLSHAEFAQLWSIIGPSVERNLALNRELWQVIAMAYLEGLLHGRGLAQRNKDIET